MHVGFALDHDLVVIVIEYPVPVQLLRQIPGHPRLDDGPAIDLGIPPATDGSDSVLLHGEPSEIDRLGRGLVVDDELHVIDVEPQCHRHALDGVSEGAETELRQVCDFGRCLGQPDAQRLPGLCRLVDRDVRRLHDRYFLDVPADGGHRRDHGVDPAGVDAGDVERTTASLTRRGQLVLRLALNAADVEEQIRADDIQPTFEQPDGVVEVSHKWVVEDRVGLQGDERVDVGGREHSSIGSTAQRSGVGSCLLLGVGVDTHQCEPWVVEDASQAQLANFSGGPLDDPQLVHDVLHLTITRRFVSL
jgi:hypothetical protein